MSIGDFLFGKTDKLTPQDIRAPWQVALHQRLGEAAEGGALSRLQRAGEPYPGTLTAGLSGYEQWGMKGLGDYLESPLASESPLFQAGKGELLSTLEGDEYDPFKGEYYKAYRANKMRELEDAKDRLASRTSARDKMFGGGRIKTEGKMEEGVTGDLMQVLGGLQEAERARKLGAVGPATQMSMFEEMEPLGRVETALGFGSLPRQLEQSGYDREYAEWMRQLSDLGIPLEVATKMSLYKPEMEYPLYGSTPGYFGGPTGVSMQPGGGYGGAQTVKDMLAKLAQFGQETGYY